VSNQIFIAFPAMAEDYFSRGCKVMVKDREILREFERELGAREAPD
jgi:hypothetical protein